MPDALLMSLASDLSIMSLELRGSVLLLKKQPAEGGALFQQAADSEKALGYREPPEYIRPVGETYGAALLAAQDWPGARAAYQAALAERPHSGFPLFGIARSHEGAGDIPAAVAAYGEFLEAWKNADAGSPEIAHARAYVSEHRG
jgi:tetratricopeptide (TPR) repeat protein